MGGRHIAAATSCVLAQVDRQNERALRDVLIALGGEAAPS